jgi:hypothetical protein
MLAPRSPARSGPAELDLRSPAALSLSKGGGVPTPASLGPAALRPQDHRKQWAAGLRGTQRGGAVPLPRASARGPHPATSGILRGVARPGPLC